MMIHDSLLRAIAESNAEVRNLRRTPGMWPHPLGRKPHLYRGRHGDWFCIGGGRPGMGRTAAEAYRAWEGQ